MNIGYYELAYDDIEQISLMEKEFFSVPWSEAGIAHYAEAGNTIFVVARSDEPFDLREKTGGFPERAKSLDDKREDAKKSKKPKKVAGYLAVFCAGDEGNLVSIGVRKEYRRMGIARELLDIAYEMALLRGVRSINLEVRESNNPAISLYESEGFELKGKRPSFYREPLEDALIYIKEL